MKYFVFNQENGYIGVAVIIDDSFDPFRFISPDGIFMTPSEMEDYDNEFFGAIKLINGQLHTNLDKAKEITQARLRRERVKAFETLDVLYQRALESGKDLKEIEDEKQRLRDITKEVDKITTIKELKILEAKTELDFSKLRDLDYSTDQYIMNLQKENAQLKETVEQLNNHMNTLNVEVSGLLSKLKKKFII